jgi:hypothetical protein
VRPQARITFVEILFSFDLQSTPVLNDSSRCCVNQLFSESIQASHSSQSNLSDSIAASHPARGGPTRWLLRIRHVTFTQLLAVLALLALLAVLPTFIPGYRLEGHVSEILRRSHVSHGDTI